MTEAAGKPAAAVEANAVEVKAVRSAEPVVFALAGRDVVIPIAPEEAVTGAWRPAGEPEIAFVTGERVESEVYWISGALRAEPATWGWLLPTVEWRALTMVEVVAAREAGNDPQGSPGFWAVLARMPARASGRELRLDGRPMAVRWLADPPLKTDSRCAPQPRASAESLRGLGAMLREEDRDPSRRWRVRLMLDRWPSDKLWADRPARELESASLETLASQHEWRWRAALATLGRAGPDTAAEVLSRLTAVVLSPEGVLLPAWSLDDASGSRLRAALLRAGSDDEDRLNEAQAWLASLVPAVAWVVDDGVVVDTARRARTAVAELTGKRARVSVTPEGAPAEDSKMVEEHETIVVTTEAPVGAKPLEALKVQAGKWNGRVAFRATALAVSPPGLAIGPLLPQWRMAGWLAGSPGAVDAEWTTAGLLHRSESGGGWEVYVECRIGTDAETVGGDAVRVYWGAAGAAERVIEVKSPMRAEIDGDRWTVTVPLPAKAIEADGTVQLGLERVDARGARSSWPRPVMPGQAEPARALIDLKGWAELKGK